MNQVMSDLCSRVLQIAEKNGADDCKVTLTKARQVEISYREQKPEMIKEALTQSLVLEIYVNRRYVYQATSDLRLKSIRDFIAKAIANTKLLAVDPDRCLPDPKYYEGRSAIDLKITDPAYGKLTPEKRHALVKAMETACLVEGGAQAITVIASLQDQFIESLGMTSNGFKGFANETTYMAAASMNARDEGVRRPSGYHYNNVRMFKELSAPQEIGRTAARRTVDLLGAKKIKTERLPVMVENRSAGRVLKGLLDAMTAYNIQQKQSFLIDKKDQKIAGDLFTLIDDPLLISGLSSRLFDNDGLTARQRTIFESGILKNFYIDWYYGRKLGWEPNGGHSSNLILPPGKRAPEQIMRDLGRGIFITDFIGGNSNPLSGDFSIGIVGFLFENGVPTQPIAEMNLADNHLRFWGKLVEAANDPWPYSSWRIPSLAFRDVVVSGV
jgi:PmbA protein